MKCCGDCSLPGGACTPGQWPTRHREAQDRPVQLPPGPRHDGAKAGGGGCCEGEQEPGGEEGFGGKLCGTGWSGGGWTAGGAGAGEITGAVAEWECGGEREPGAQQPGQVHQTAGQEEETQGWQEAAKTAWNQTVI